MTKKEMYVEIANLCSSREDIVEFCNHEIELLSKRHTSDNSKAKREAAERAEKVYNALAEMTDPVTCGELIKMTSDPDVGGYTIQRVSAIMTTLGSRVKKEKVGKKTLFSIA